ncbi:MAG: hypothetical protein J6S85_04525 [Methanobrevibacter sp.]|nr:hypothetical protein [Methanobrevibacter sp.]MBO7712811.1 hypothetical protein [Methanobrevibacter sp.]
MEITLNIEDKRSIIEKANKIILAPNQDNYSLDDLISIIDELTHEYDHLEEEFMDYKAMVQDNYEEKNPYDLYGVCECDFH